MALDFLRITTNAILRHGTNCSFIAVAEGTYNVETGSVTNTEASYTLKMYKKHIRANQYNFPDLIGKDSAMFYVANDSLGFAPVANDKVIFDGETYVVQSVMEYAARGEIVFFKIIGVKG